MARAIFSSANTFMPDSQSHVDCLIHRNHCGGIKQCCPDMLDTKRRVIIEQFLVGHPCSHLRKDVIDGQSSPSEHRFAHHYVLAFFDEVLPTDRHVRSSTLPYEKPSLTILRRTARV